MSEVIGTLIVVVLKARNLRDKHSFSKQDPFAKLAISGIAQQTKIDKRGGQHPLWDEEFRFPIVNATTDKHRKLEVSCYAKESKSDDLLGKAQVDISDTLRSGEFDEWVALELNGAYCGEIYLEMTFYSSAAPPVPEKSSAAKSGVSLLAPPASGANLQRHPSKLSAADRTTRLTDVYQYPPDAAPSSASRPARESPGSSPAPTRRLRPDGNTQQNRDRYPSKLDAPPSTSSPSSSRSSSASPGRHGQTRVPSAAADVQSPAVTAVPAVLRPGRSANVREPTGQSPPRTDYPIAEYPIAASPPRTPPYQDRERTVAYQSVTGTQRQQVPAAAAATPAPYLPVESSAIPSYVSPITPTPQPKPPYVTYEPSLPYQSVSTPARYSPPITAGPRQGAVTPQPAPSTLYPLNIPPTYAVQPPSNLAPYPPTSVALYPPPPSPQHHLYQQQQQPWRGPSPSPSPLGWSVQRTPTPGALFPPHGGQQQGPEAGLPDPYLNDKYSHPLPLPPGAPVSQKEPRSKTQPALPALEQGETTAPKAQQPQSRQGDKRDAALAAARLDAEQALARRKAQEEEDLKLALLLDRELNLALVEESA